LALAHAPVTVVFRREVSEWRIVHGHGDSLASPAASEMADRLAASDH
jgi:ketosteroid isomerase-like protein